MCQGKIKFQRNREERFRIVKSLKAMIDGIEGMDFYSKALKFSLPHLVYNGEPAKMSVDGFRCFPNTTPATRCQFRYSPQATPATRGRFRCLPKATPATRCQLRCLPYSTPAPRCQFRYSPYSPPTSRDAFRNLPKGIIYSGDTFIFSSTINKKIIYTTIK